MDLRRNASLRFLMMAACLLCFGLAQGQSYPVKPIRFIVPQDPGTDPDKLARVVGPEMSKILGQPLVIENKPGTNSIIGFEFIAKAPPDGYTIAVASVPGLAILPVIVKDLRFDPLKDLPAFIGVAQARFVFGSSTRYSWKSFNEMVAYAKANPGKINYGAAAAQVRLPIEALVRDLGLDGVYIPYRGGALYLQALASGDLHFGFLSQAAAIAMGDKFRVLAVTGEERAAGFRDAATFKEVGMPQIRGLALSFNAPAGTPKLALDKLYAAASRALQQPEVRAGIAKFLYEVNEETPEQAARRLAEEAKFYAEVGRRIGMQPQ